MKYNIWFLFCTLFLCSLSEKKEKEWWFTKHERVKNEKLAHKMGLRDTSIDLTYSNFHFWSPIKFDKSKQTLVFVQGMSTDGLSQYSKQIAFFAQKYNVIIPDLVGYAKSTNKTDEYSPEIQAKTIHELLVLLQEEKNINIAGFSYGGLVTATYHYLYESEVRKIAVCDAPVKYFTARVADSILEARGLVHFERLISPTNAYETEHFFNAILSGKSPFRTKKIENNIIKHIFQVNAVAKRKQMDHLGNFAEKYTTMDYKFHSTNVLFLWGDLDGAIPKVVGDNLHKEYPEAKYYIVKGAKHDALLTFKDEFNQVLNDHFKAD